MPNRTRTAARLLAGALSLALSAAPVFAQDAGNFPVAPTAPAGAAPVAQGTASATGNAPYAAQNQQVAMAVQPESPADVGTASQRFSAGEVVQAGHDFFGQASGSIGALVERLFSRYGLPNGYILGEEGSGAYFGGLTYGEGVLYTRNAGQHRIYWQGPSLGFDWGAQGSRTMILVYNLPEVNATLGRFGGMSGEAFLIGGLGTRVLKKGGVVMVPVRTGVGARLGVNLNYLKFTAEPTWNPF